MAADVIISADSHVFEPIDLWEKRLDKRFRERGPRYIRDYQGKPGTWFVCEGATPRSVAGIGAVGIPKEELAKFAGSHYQDLRPGGYDPVERLKDQDIDGVSAEVLYPTYAMGLYAVEDIELRVGPKSKFLTWEAELTTGFPLGPGAFLMELAGSYVTGVPDPYNVYEETIRVVVDPPWVWRTRFGYLFAIDPDRTITIGPVMPRSRSSSTPLITSPPISPS